MSKSVMQDFKTINKMALPVISGLVVETFFGIADKAIIGRTSVEGFVGVGVSSTVIYTLTGTFGVLAFAFNILFAKAIGKNETKEAEKIFNTSITLAIVLGCIFQILVLLFSEFFFSKFYHLSSNALKYACDYMKIASLGFGINLVLFILSAYFKNIRKTKIYFYSTLCSLSVNFIIDYTLVFGKFGFPVMGVKGAAIGTVIGLSVGLCIYILSFINTNFIKFRIKIAKVVIKDLIKLYIPLLGQDFIESTLFILIITSIITNLNVYYVATYNLIETINSFILFPVYAYAGSALTLVAQEYSKKNIRKAKAYPKVAVICSLISVVFLGGIFIMNPQITSMVITNDNKLIQTASNIIPLAIGIQIFNTLNQVYKYCLQGIDHEKWVFMYSLIVSAISSIIIFVIVKYTKLGLTGIYIGLAISYSILGGGYMIKYINSFSKTTNATLATMENQ